MNLIKETCYANEERIRREISDPALIAASLEAETERVYQFDTIAGKYYIGEGYTLHVMNEGVEGSCRVFYIEMQVVSATTKATAMKALLKNIELPAPYYYSTGTAYSKYEEVFIKQPGDGTRGGSWVKDGEKFIKGYGSFEAKKNLLAFLLKRHKAEVRRAEHLNSVMIGIRAEIHQEIRREERRRERGK